MILVPDLSHHTQPKSAKAGENIEQNAVGMVARGTRPAQYCDCCFFLFVFLVLISARVLVVGMSSVLKAAFIKNHPQLDDPAIY